MIYAYSDMFGLVEYQTMPDADNVRIGTCIYDADNYAYYQAVSCRTKVIHGAFTKWTKHGWIALRDINHVPKKLQAYVLLLS